MKTKWIVSILVIATLLISVTATASMLIPANDKAKENAKAPENSGAIIENWALEANGLIRVDFIHYVKPSVPGKAPKAPTCYKLLGVKWKSLLVSYVINPNNPHGLSEKFVTSAISASAETWDAATASELFDNDYIVDDGIRYRVQDFKNAIVFGDYPNDNVIAVTSFWYIPREKQLVEFDILFNTRFTWGDAEKEGRVMDLQNIATHELGHGVGLDDVYSSSCSEVTMYGYSSYGETKERTLETPDITGLQTLYGA